MFSRLALEVLSDLKGLPEEHEPGPLTVLLHVRYLTNKLPQMIS